MQNSQSGDDGPSRSNPIVHGYQTRSIPDSRTEGLLTPPSSGAARSPRLSSSNRQSCRDYVQAIVAHSRRYTANSLYPGQNYLKLAAWLQQETHHKSILDVKYTSAVLHCFAADGPPEILRYRHQDLETFTNQIRLEHRINRILFLRGYTSPDWISTIGSVFRIDPEFFNRHLAFMTTLVSRSAFSTPSLSSSCRNIITLRINTILVQNGISLRKEFKNLAARRRSEAAGLNAYSRLYQTTAHYGDSIVRDFCTLDDHYSVLEQEISVCVRKSKGNWLALVWADVGRDLTLGPNGPWLSNHSALGDSASSFPIIQHHVKMVTRQTYTESSNPSLESSEISALNNSAIQQSTMLLPFDCNSLTDSETAKQDAFYALNPVFQHAAFSEVQFINLMEWQIDKEMGILTLKRDRSHSLDNLQYFHSILDRHIRQMRDVLRTTKLQGAGGWPSASESKRQKKAALAADQLVTDYDGLLVRALELCERCTEGMGVMMNRAIVAESKKAIDQAERLKKLTFLASFFIPLSFTTSLFGANFSEFAPGNYLSIWVFFVVSMPVVLLSYCFYIWNIAGWIGSVRRWVRNRRRG